MNSHNWKKHWNNNFEDYRNDLERDYIIFNMMDNEKNKNKNILDIGCAKGELLSFLKKRGFMNLWGIDFSKEMIDICRHNKIENVSVQDAERIYYKDNSFDIIIASGLIEYLKEDNKFIEECKRLLKNNGILIISYRNSLFSKWSEKEYDTKRRTHNPIGINYYGFKTVKSMFFHKHYPSKGLNNKFRHSAFISMFVKEKQNE